MPKSTPTTPPLDREAKRRLAVIRHVEEVTGNVVMSCRYFGISRQAYYAWYRRYQAEGVEGLRARSKAPKTSPNATLWGPGIMSPGLTCCFGSAQISGAASRFEAACWSW